MMLLALWRYVMHKPRMTIFSDKLTVADIRTLDADDALQNRHTLFDLPEGVIYLVGHSLGPASLTALARLNEAAAADWAGDIVGAWNSAGWIDLAETTGDRISRLIGAAPGEVIVCDSVSVNLFKLAAAALPLANGARAIRVEVGEFPTDQYVAEALSGLVGATFERLEHDAGLNALKAGGVLIKSAVNFRSGEVADIAAHEAEAAKRGAVIVWDLSHATGVVDVRLGEAGAKLAAGCTYKYVNGGPGSPAFVYASADIVLRLETPLPGWMGHASPFAFENAYTPRDGVARFAAGTPPILSLAALAGALDAFDEVDVATLARKAGVLGDLVIAFLSTERGESFIRSSVLSSKAEIIPAR